MIRSIKIEDLFQIVKIENLTQAVPWSESIFKDCILAGYIGWVYELDHHVIAFALLNIHSEECHLLNLAVHPDYQHQGYGRQMLEHATEFAKKSGAVMIYLEVRESNHKAIALYKKSGFIQIGTRKDYYPGIQCRENAAIYARDLGLEILKQV